MFLLFLLVNQIGKTSLDLNEARDDQSINQSMMGFWDAVASAGPYENSLHRTPDR